MALSIPRDAVPSRPDCAACAALEAAIDAHARAIRAGMDREPTLAVVRDAAAVVDLRHRLRDPR